MKSRRLIISLVLGLILTLTLTWALADQFDFVAAAPSGELRVCQGGCPYASIQQAVDDAEAGDVIKVATGTYTDVHSRAGTVQVVYITKTVTIEGGYTTANWITPDPQTNQTVLNAQGSGRVVVIAPPSERPSTPAAERPSALSLLGQQVGATAQTIAPVVSGFHIVGGDATAGSSFYYDGGGISVLGARARIANNWIYGNTAGVNGIGGGIFVQSYAPQEVQLLEVPESTLIANRVYSNYAGDGSGIALQFSAAKLINNAVFDNEAYAGAAIAVLESTSRMWHTTVARNTALEGSAGIAAWSWEFGSSLQMTNTIVSNHSYAGVVVDQYTDAALNGVLWHDNGWNTVGLDRVAVTNAYTGSPTFAPDGYHLTNVSAAIDRGVDSPVPDDIEGEIRPQGDAPDLGADEYAVGTIVVQKVADPPSSTEFSFGIGAAAGPAQPFTLTHGQSERFNNISAGTYYVTEQSDVTFDLTDLTCEENVTGNSSIDQQTRQATLELDPGETITCTFNNLVSTPPSGGSTDSDGLDKDAFKAEETVYATGSGFVPGTTVDVYIVPDLTWTNGLTIASDLSLDGFDTLAVHASGDLGPAAVWPPQLAPGEYDLVFDANRNGHYDSDTDVVDDPNHPGFVVEPIQILVDPELGATLIYTDPQGLPTIFQIPPGAVTQPISICFSPLLSPTHALPSDIAFGNHAFQFGACAQQPPAPIPVGGVTFPALLAPGPEKYLTPLGYPYLPVILRSKDGGSIRAGASEDKGNRGAKALPAPSLQVLRLPGDQATVSSTVFEQPVTITIYYSDTDVQGIDETELLLLYWTGSAWADAAGTCLPSSAYVRDPVNNTLQVEICHLSEFAFGG